MVMAASTQSMLPQPYAVQQVLKETADTFTLTLGPSNGVEAKRFQPGQFSMLWVFGVGEVPISISGDPAEHLTSWCTPCAPSVRQPKCW